MSQERREPPGEFDPTAQLNRTQGRILSIGQLQSYEGVIDIKRLRVQSRVIVLHTQQKDRRPVAFDEETKKSVAIRHQVDVIATAGRLPFRDKSLGGIIAGDIYARDRSAMFAAANRALKDGGILVLPRIRLEDIQTATSRGFSLLEGRTNHVSGIPPSVDCVFQKLPRMR
jgi:hypothetical protein